MYLLEKFVLFNCASLLLVNHTDSVFLDKSIIEFRVYYIYIYVFLTNQMSFDLIHFVLRGSERFKIIKKCIYY